MRTATVDGDPDYRMRPQDVGRRPIKVRFKVNSRGIIGYRWRCRYCNATSHRFAKASTAHDAGLAHYWGRCVTVADLDVAEARESGKPERVHKAQLARIWEQLAASGAIPLAA